MFTLTVSDSIMIAHSLKGAVFGPAQNMHGATFVIEAEFFRDGLDQDGIVADIGAASTLLSDVLSGLNFQNLDEHPAFAGRNSTTEVVTQFVAEELKSGVKAGKLGGDTATAISKIKITTRENPSAWASFEVAL
ncbi:MAG: 6-carboxytetrahydropterin synthase [Pseudomonadota bacterium]